MGSCVAKNSRRDIIVPTRSVDSTLSSEAKSTSPHDDSKRTELSDNQLVKLPQNSKHPKKLSSNYAAIPNKTRQENPVTTSQFVGGLIGLKNLGNTCFINSALQCLLHMPPLVDYFLHKLHFHDLNIKNPLGSKGMVTLAFARLVKRYWKKSDIDQITPKELYDVISEYAPRFGQGTQEDCHEFLVSFLDVLHEDLNRVKQKAPFEDAECLDDGKLEECAKESWKNYLTRNQSVIVDLLQGQSKSTLKCLKCGAQSHKFEPFMYLSLPIPDEDAGKVSLLDCLKEYSKEEKLQEEELWSCPKCKTLVEATKKLDIWKLPNILIVHLKRFKYNRKTKGKITTLVDFPIVDLDLSSIATGTQHDRPIYDLFAVSNHNGSLNRGHYYTFAKNREDNAWYAFNDSDVMTLEPKQVVSPTGYLLFFCKVSIDSFKRQSLSKPENWPHAPRIIKTNIRILTIDTRRSSVASANDLEQKTGSTNKNAVNKLIMDSGSAESLLRSVEKFDTTSVSSAATVTNGQKTEKRYYVAHDLSTTGQKTPDSTTSNFSTDPFFKNLRQPRDKQQEQQQVKEKASSVDKTKSKGNKFSKISHIQILS